MTEADYLELAADGETPHEELQRFSCQLYATAAESHAAAAIDEECEHEFTAIK